MVVYKTYEKLRTEKMRAVIRTQSAILFAARRFFEKHGFVEIRAPVIESFSDPGLRGAQIFDIDFYGRQYQLMSALTLQKPLLAEQAGKFFSLCPCLRKESEESAKTGRHLAEFYQIEVEIPDTDYFGAMGVAEQLVSSVISEVKQKCSPELEFFKRKLCVPSTPFKKMRFSDAVETARKLGFDASLDREIPWEAEKAISLSEKAPFFVVDYPLGSRGFYDKDDAGFQRSFDLMYPEGFGEAISGSQREYEYEKLKQKVSKLGSKHLELYLQLAKKGIKPTAGFGLGLERLTRYVCGLESIEDAAPFAKLPGG